MDESERQARARVGCVLDDKWTLERLLGIGGMAAVYAARHRNGARAAVKVLHAALSRHKEVRERFLREGYASNRVGHAGAVKVLDDDVVVSGPESGTAYLVMELLEGQSLQDRVERGPPVGELEFLSIARSVLEVLEAAHARGVVHRDLKPENLFLVQDVALQGASPAAQVKVLDFGLARLIQGQAITTYGLALGTPSFMSPEQAAGRIDEIDGRTDLFALGATGFRICAGRRIHEGDNPVDLVRKMANLAAPRVRTVRADVSESCGRVIDRALEFRRADRYETASAMREDVERAIAEIEARGPTQLAVQAVPSKPLPLADAPHEDVGGDDPTLELSRADPDPQEPPVPSPLGYFAPEESIRIPKRRSLLAPVAALVAFVAVAAIIGKLGLAHRAAKVGGPLSASSGGAAIASSPPLTAASDGASAANVPVDVDAGADASAADGAGPAATAATQSAASRSPDNTRSNPAGKVPPNRGHQPLRKHLPSKPAKSTKGSKRPPPGAAR